MIINGKYIASQIICTYILYPLYVPVRLETRILDLIFQGRQSLFQQTP